MIDDFVSNVSFSFAEFHQIFFRCQMSTLKFLLLRIAEISAKNPKLTITLVLAIVVILCGGISLLEITINPIKLWAAPNSRARVERRFFESTFRPFFRTEHIIFKHSGNELKPFNHTNLFDQTVTYSPVFDKRFLKEVLELKQSIQNIQSAEGVKLNDVCHQPLYPASTECNIQSIWGYWQDDVDKFEEVGTNFKTGHIDNYLDHLLLCSRNPTQLKTQTVMGHGCLSKGGVPVQPFFVLGGYNQSNYNSECH